MAIFGSTGIFESDTNLPEVEEVMGTMEGSDQILYEAAQDFYKINAGLYISDVLIEQAVTEGASDPEALMEGTVKDFFKRIIDAIKKFWAKVKAWFKNVIETIKVFFMSGEKFIKQYESKLKAKNAKGFEYTAYKYTFGTANKMYASIEKACDKVIKDIPGKIGANTSVKAVKAAFGDAGELESADFVEKICKAGASNASTISELKNAMLKGTRNNSDEPQEWVDFNGNTKDYMISVVKDHKKTVSEIEKYDKETEAKFANLVKAYESLERSMEGGKSDALSIISKAASNARSALSILQGVNATYISLVREEYGTFVSILKRYAVYKEKESTKESVEGSLLESAMALL